jgi:hypothetical protein
VTTYTDCLKLIEGQDCLARHDPDMCAACFCFAELEGEVFAAEVGMETGIIVEHLRREHVLSYGACFVDGDAS